MIEAMPYYTLENATDGDRAALLCTAVRLAWDHFGARRATVRVQEAGFIEPDDPLLTFGFALEEGPEWRLGPVAIGTGSTYLTAAAPSSARACDLVQRRLTDETLFSPMALDIEFWTDRGSALGALRVPASLDVVEIGASAQVQAETLLESMTPMLEREAESRGVSLGHG